MHFISVLSSRSLYHLVYPMPYLSFAHSNTSTAYSMLQANLSSPDLIYALSFVLPNSSLSLHKLQFSHPSTFSHTLLFSRPFPPLAIGPQTFTSLNTSPFYALEIEVPAGPYALFTHTHSLFISLTIIFD